MRSSTIFSCLSLSGLCYSAQSNGFATFLSAPGQVTPVVNLFTINTTLLDPGYIFLTPYQFGGEFYAPTIYGPSGNLFWSGEYTEKQQANNFHTTLYKNESGDHFVYSDSSGTIHQSGVIRFFNESYQQVGPDYTSLNGLPLPDDHELNVPASSNGANLIFSIYKTVKKDLTKYKGPKNGYVISGCFQEISLLNNSLIFQWCSLGHVPLYETYAYLPGSGNYSDSLAGKGTSDNPFDYFHINSIDKDTDGNYLVSSRQTSTLYKVAGLGHPNPGSIIWRLGGKANSFKMSPSSFNFSFQHDGRWQSPPSKTSTLITLFDNAYDGEGRRSASASSGLLISVNENKKVATLKQQYVQPNNLLIGSQGSVQLLPSGNVFICWGQLPYLSEFTRSGTLVLNAKFGNLNPSASTLSSYKGYKQSWTGKPSIPPKAFAYSQFCNSTVAYAYASWNGAGNVAYWKLQTSNNEDGPWTLGATQYTKKTWETVLPYDNSDFSQYVQAVAYDSSDKLLEISPSTGVFVPADQFQKQCSEKSCPLGFSYSSSNNQAQNCSSSA